LKTITTKTAIAVASGVAVASLVAPAVGTASAAPKTTSPAAAAAGYLARTLVGPHHDHYTETFGKQTFVNYGETADAVLSMDAAGVSGAAAARATKYLEVHVGAYAGKSAGTYAPGPIGKLLLVAEAQHISVTAFGGKNLVAELAATEGARGAAPGEYQQNSAGTPAKFDYTSTTSQALAVLALADTQHSGAQPDAAAVTYLVSQQCGDGAYPVEILSTVVAGCTAKAGKDVDATAYAAQALIATGQHRAADKALAWLKSKQHKNGGFGEAAGSTADANSTAVAVEALVDGHDSVVKPEKWLHSAQVGCSAKADRRGAVTFEGKYDSSAGVATSQAAEALAGKPLAWVDQAGVVAAAPVLACK
jgi:hypothetical protein